MRAPHAGEAVAVRELHALAGEASVLGLSTVAELARAAEGRWRVGAWTSVEEWSAALDAIAQAVLGA
jgi:HPt (histidine-containing phosphotransfer) domain-containing protein